MANYAHVTDEAIASDVGIEANDLANEAADANVANRANKASFADEADDAVESDAANEADLANKAADVAETTEADEADVANYAIVADDVDHGAAVLYSLTKYSAIFAEVKRYFGLTAPDNQLGRKSLCSLRSKNRCQLDNQLEDIVEKGLV